MNKKIPEWLTTTEDYTPLKDHDNFIQKSTLCILRVLSKIKTQNTYNEKHPEITSLQLLFYLLIIILTSCSKNFYFIVLIITFILVKLCFLKSNTILMIFKFQIYTLLLSTLILAPSIIFMNNLYNSIFILSKIYITTTLMMIFSTNTQWNLLSSSLKSFKIPDICIFIFDITLKYIILLGNLCLDMITALKLRSVGFNNEKQKSLSSIVGTIFIKSTEMSEEMINAMECRGFTGEYTIKKGSMNKTFFIVYLISSIFLILLFIYLE